MTDIEKLEADLIEHWCACSDCGVEPEEACAVALAIRQDLRLAKAINVLRYQ